MQWPVFRDRLRTLYELGWPMTKAKDHNRENVGDRREQIPEQKAEAERKKHAEERELAPEVLVEAVENPADDRAPVPKGPGSRQGDQR